MLLHVREPDHYVVPGRRRFLAIRQVELALARAIDQMNMLHALILREIDIHDPEAATDIEHAVDPLKVRIETIILLAKALLIMGRNVDHSIAALNRAWISVVGKDPVVEHRTPLTNHIAPSLSLKACMP